MLLIRLKKLLLTKSQG